MISLPLKAQFDVRFCQLHFNLRHGSGYSENEEGQGQGDREGRSQAACN